MELEYPQWQEPLAAAILEFNPRILSGKLQAAEKVISTRIKELGCGVNDAHELRLLYDGFVILRDLKRTRLGN